MFGILNIDKPPGITSRKVVDRVAKLVRPVKAGHAGTLDPLATGVLVVCVGAATRLISRVQEQVKTYRGRFLLGQRSDTDDVTGTLVPVPGADGVTRERLEALLPQFVGRIAQVPPQFSAVHVGGRRAYKLARRGEDVELKPRTVEVHRLELLEFAQPEFELEIECGSGTYIRAIGRDLGEKLGCGAVMSALVRTAIGPFRLQDAVSLDELSAETLPEHLLPAVTAVADLPAYRASAEELVELRHGRPISRRLDAADGSAVAVLDRDGEIACLAAYHADSGQLAPRQFFVRHCSLFSRESGDSI
ncbi:MAG: tRNA pseudouridine(55) synthase TruB [Planctomycetes bacterium]|nr:tRNA pseudouridine(55) synthase TruB [Planctomycetota bacterium]